MSQGLGFSLGPSALKWIGLASPVALNAAGSGNAVNTQGFEWGTLFVLAGSTNVTTQTIHLQRSATSDGTFAEFGASIPNLVDASATLHVRSFALSSSAPWLRLIRTFTGATSSTAAVGLLLGGSRKFPVDQQSNTCPFSDVL